MSVGKVGNPHPHRYKERVEETLSEEEYLTYLDIAKERDIDRDYRMTNPQYPFEHNLKPIKIGALLAVLYYTGLRVSEIVGDTPHRYKVKWDEERHRDSHPDGPDGFHPKTRYKEGFLWKTTPKIHGLRKQDMRITRLMIRIDPKHIRKHGKRSNPLWIRRDLPGAVYIVEQWENTEGREDRVFPISKWTAWKFISEITEGRLYPHYFRLNRATRFAEHEKTSIVDLREWFGWRSMETIQVYLGKAGKVTRKMAERVG